MALPISDSNTHCRTGKKASFGLLLSQSELFQTDPAASAPFQRQVEVSQSVPDTRTYTRFHERSPFPVSVPIVDRPSDVF
jgi:hypothetical protein